MRDLFFVLQVYGCYFRRFLNARMSYRFDFISGILGSAVTTLASLVYVLLLIDGTAVRSLQGWKREEVLFLYGYSMIALSVFSTLAMNLYQFSDRYIIQGNFDRILLRPINSLAQVLFESFNLDAIGNFITGVAVMLYSGAELRMEIGLFEGLWLVVSALSGSIILISVFVVVASLSFHFEDKIGISAPVYNLIAFGRYPLPIFGRPIRFLLSWIIPFGFVAFYPGTMFLKREEYWIYCYSTPLVALVTGGIASWFWRFGVSRYQSTGN